MAKKGKKGLRPHTWKVQGDIPHEQHIAWLRAKAQANFRKEEWLLTFEEFQTLWEGMWHMRGRHVENYCLTREDSDGPWDTKNTVLVNRREHLQQQAKEKGGRFGRNARSESN